jgi:hypothetical protein
VPFSSLDHLPSTLNQISQHTSAYAEHKVILDKAQTNSAAFSHVVLWHALAQCFSIRSTSYVVSSERFT